MILDVAAFKTPLRSWNRAFELAAARLGVAGAKGGDTSRLRGGSVLALQRPVGDLIVLDDTVELPADTIVQIAGPGVQGGVGIQMSAAAPNDVAFKLPVGWAPVAFQGLHFDACRVEIASGSKGQKTFDRVAFDGTTGQAAIRALGVDVLNVELRACLFNEVSKALDAQGGLRWEADRSTVVRVSQVETPLFSAWELISVTSIAGPITSQVLDGTFAGNTDGTYKIEGELELIAGSLKHLFLRPAGISTSLLDSEHSGSSNVAYPNDWGLHQFTNTDRLAFRFWCRALTGRDRFFRAQVSAGIPGTAWDSLVAAGVADDTTSEITGWTLGTTIASKLSGGTVRAFRRPEVAAA